MRGGWVGGGGVVESLTCKVKRIKTNIKQAFQMCMYCK